MKNNAIQKPNKITYETLWKAIIRPPRDEYLEEELGSPNFSIDKRRYFRKDFELLNFQGYLLKVSMIEPVPKDRPQDIMPCVIYLHANASSRIEGLHIRRFLLRRNINLCIFDFQGSGLSEGEYISLGYHEKHQVKNIVDFVEKYPGVGNIGLWGRSMGAATTLIYASMDKRIKAITVDSPFEDFRKLAKEMVLGQIKLPGFLVEGAISIIGKSVKNRNGMDINDIKAIDCVKKTEVPVVFIHARDDELVPYTSLLDFVGDFFAKHLESGYKVGDNEKMKNYIKKISTKEELKDKKKDIIKIENLGSDDEEEEEEDEGHGIKNIFDLKTDDIVQEDIINNDENIENKESNDETTKEQSETIEKNQIIMDEKKDKDNENKDNNN